MNLKSLKRQDLRNKNHEKKSDLKSSNENLNLRKIMEQSRRLLDTLQHMLLLSENLKMLFINHFPSETTFSFLNRQQALFPARQILILEDLLWDERSYAEYINK